MSKKYRKYQVGLFFLCVAVLVVYLVISRKAIFYHPESQSSPDMQTTGIIQLQPSPSMQGKEHPTRKSDPTGQALENGWYRFTYPEAGYFIDYPPNTNLVLAVDPNLEYKEATLYLPGTKVDSGLAMKIIIELNSENKPLDQFADEKLLQYFGQNISSADGKIEKETTSIAGYSSLIAYSKPNCPIIFIESKNRVFILFLLPNMTSGTMPSTESVELFWNIVDTFAVI